MTEPTRTGENAAVDSDRPTCAAWWKCDHNEGWPHPAHRPRLLDLFCCAGGAAMGYHRAGFEVVGIDIDPQPNYPFEFHQADAMTFPLDGFDAIHASPPCQAYSRATAWTGDRSSHPDLIAPVQERLRASGLPYVIENVQEARYLLDNPIMLCGTGFGRRFRSHRYFEVWPPVNVMVHPCHHQPALDASRDHGAKQTETAFRSALGCDWMTVHEARQAIPPVYTEFLGGLLVAACGQSLAATPANASSPETADVRSAADERNRT